MSEAKIEHIRSLVREVPDFPKPGIGFKDITPVLADPAALADTVELMAQPFREHAIDAVFGIESRGFILGAPLALYLGVAFVPVRKPGKLPAARVSVEYTLEYGTDTVEVHRDAVPAGARVLVCDDVIATGGTAAATVELVAKLGATCVGATFLMELGFLDGAARLGELPRHAVLRY